MSEPTLAQWLIVKGIQTANKVAGWCGNVEAKKSDAQFAAIKLKFKLADKVHKYASLKGISHEKAAKELGVALPPDVLEQIRMYDPEHWHEHY